MIFYDAYYNFDSLVGSVGRLRPKQIFHAHLLQIIAKLNDFVEAELLGYYICQILSLEMIKGKKSQIQEEEIRNHPLRIKDSPH